MRRPPCERSAPRENIELVEVAIVVAHHHEKAQVPGKMLEPFRMTLEALPREKDEEVLVSTRTGTALRRKTNLFFDRTVTDSG